MMKRFFIGCILFLFTVLAFAEEGQELTTIKGTNIDMKIYDHAMAGAIKDFVVWGFFDEANGVSELIMRKNGQIIKASFQRNEAGKTGGMIIEKSEKGERSTVVELLKIVPAEKQIHLKLNGKLTVLAIESERASGPHQINPTLSTTLGGEKITYTIGGESCFMKLSHLSMMILGAYSH